MSFLGLSAVFKSNEEIYDQLVPKEEKCKTFSRQIMSNDDNRLGGKKTDFFCV